MANLEPDPDPEPTFGDDQEVDCPACGVSQDMTDFGIDGCLRSGFEWECADCQARLVFHDVYWSATIEVRLVR